MKKTAHRLLALALAICMMVAMTPAVFAAPGNNTVDTGKKTIDSGFLVQLTDMANKEQSNIAVPNGFKLKVLDKDSKPIDEIKYQVDWCYETEEDGTVLYKQDKAVLELPATTIFMLNFSLFPVVKDRKTGSELERPAVPDLFLSEPEGSYLVINGKPVRPGEKSEEGVSLSSDSKTVTLDNVELNDTESDLWGTSPIFMDLLDKDVKILVKGTNVISSEKSSAMSVIRNHEKTVARSSCIMEGDSLTLRSSSENALIVGTGLRDDEAPTSDFTIRGMFLDLSAQSEDAETSADSALRMQKGTLTIDDCQMKATSDFLNTIELDTPETGTDDSGLVVTGSEVYVVNNTNIRQDREVLAETKAVAVYVGGDNAMLLDHSQLKIEMKTRTAEQVLAYGALNAIKPTRIINGSAVSVVLKDPVEKDDNVNLLVCGLVSSGFDIQNSAVDINLEGTPDQAASVWGIGYSAGKFEATKDAKITINVDGKFAEGIRYFYAFDKEDKAMADPFGGFFPPVAGEELGDVGTVNIFDANVNVNAFSDTTTSKLARPAGISGRFLNVSFSQAKYGLNVRTTAALDNSTAVLFTKRIANENVSYTKGYRPEVIKIRSNSRIISPVPGETNLFGYSESEAQDRFMHNEVIYGKDRTKPAASVSIGFTGSSSGGGSSGGSSTSNPVAVNLDTTTDDVVNGKVDTAKLAQEALAAVQASKTSLLIRNATEISAEALQKVYDASKTMLVHADTTVNGVTTLRLTLTPAAGKALPQSIQLGGTLTAAVTKAHFAKYFTNEISVVSLSQKGTFGMPVGVAVRADLSKLNATALQFYSFDRETNKYRLVKTKYSVDANGYLHFTTTLAGDIIITDQLLTAKA